MIPQKVEENPGLNEKPSLAPPTSINYQQAPLKGKAENKAKPDSSQPKEEIKEVVEAPVPLKEELPEEHEATFQEKVARGKELKEDGINAPGWTADVDTWMIDHLQKKGEVRLFVRTANSVFAFTGGLTKPGFAIEVDKKNELRVLSGFSMRGMNIDSKRARNLLRKLKAHRVIEAFALFSAEIDAMILASQEAAARKVALRLEDVGETKGSFEQKGGLPFNYKVLEIKNRSGEWTNL